MTDKTDFGIALVAGAALVGSIWVGGNAIHAAHVEGTKRIETCVNAGGSWIEHQNLCIQTGGSND